MNHGILTGSGGPPLAGSGRVLASFGRSALIESERELLHCGLMGRRLRVICGDRVQWRRQSPDGVPNIEALSKRDNVFERIDNRGRPEAIAANIDRLAIVLAPEPEPDWFMIDRYWAGAVLKDIPSLLVVNKRDLDSNSIAAELSTYRRYGLNAIEVSSRFPADALMLQAKLAGGACLFVGQSGVGKSSLINALIPDAAAQTAELTRDLEGKHTTTTARCYLMPGNSALIDAPGVRDFAPPATLARAAEFGFVEIHARRGDCRFNDCRHFDEPGCAVSAAVQSGEITARRYESYRRLARLFEGFSERR